MRRWWPKLKEKSPRELVFYLLPLFLALVIFFWVIYPRLKAIQTHRALLAQKEKNLKTYKKKISSLKKTLRQPKVETKKLVEKVFYGNDPYVVVAGLKEKFAKVPEVSIRSFRIVKREKKGNFLEKVVINFVLQTTVKGLAEILWQIENEPKAVRIKRLSLFLRRLRGTEKLSVTLELEGLFWLKKA